MIELIAGASGSDCNIPWCQKGEVAAECGASHLAEREVGARVAGFQLQDAAQDVGGSACPRLGLQLRGLRRKAVVALRHFLIPLRPGLEVASHRLAMVTG